MNRPDDASRLIPIPDTQGAADERDIAIDRVGIKGLRYPLPFVDRDGVAQTSIATCNVYVALPADRKGTHMSRLVALLEARAAPGAAPISVANLRNLLDDLVVRLAAALDDGRYTSTLCVSAPVTSLCPCSKEISDYGAHNQRSLVTIGVRPRAPVFLTELLRIAEEEASAELYGILKRVDEKYLTERAYDNPRFVEDLVRGVAARLGADARFDGFIVEAENFESIHNHSAYARIARGW
jgi:GTP cyclohydrolase I